jgi:cell shape-determining protein MreC
MIGTITKITPEKSTNNFMIEVKSSADFYNLTYVYALDNLQKDEINKLLDKVKNQNK